MVDSLLDRGSKVYRFLDPKAVRKLLDEHASGRQDNHKMLFSLIVFEQWQRTQEAPAAALK
jgi:asparagine synthase (glutamine-hydrolysing)